MERSTLARILTQATGVKGEADTWQTEEDHRLTFYLGQPGQAMIVANVAKVRFDEEFIQLTRVGRDGELFVTYDAVHGLGVVLPEGERGRRAGFL
ncbi:MAG: hypothetical protein KF901_26850 [Myxococcales bacterium]|nr:hypothetical protein [Myxococcales bacterium]